MFPTKQSMHVKKMDPYERVFASDIEIPGQRGDRTFLRESYEHWSIPQSMKRCDPSILLIHNLFSYAITAWSSSIEKVKLSRYSIKVSLNENLTPIPEMEWQSMEKAVGMLFAALVREVMIYAEIYDTGIKLTYELFAPRSEIFSRILPGDRSLFTLPSDKTYFKFFLPLKASSNQYLDQMGNQNKKFILELTQIPGIEILALSPKSLSVNLGYVFINNKEDLHSQVLSLLRKHIDANIVFNTDGSNMLSNLVPWL